MTQILDATITTTETGCLSVDLGSGGAAGGGPGWERDGDVIVLEGRRRAPNPCHEAVLTDVAVAGRRLQVEVGVERLPGICQQCLGEISYEVTIELRDGAVVDGVDVSHE